jgi:hypothetical protein
VRTLLEGLHQWMALIPAARVAQAVHLLPRDGADAVIRLHTEVGGTDAGVRRVCMCAAVVVYGSLPVSESLPLCV